MKLSIASSLLVSTAFLFDDVHASVHRLRGVRGSRSPLTGLGRRVAMSGDLQNSGDVKYWTNVTMGGKSVSLLLDTGRYVFPIRSLFYVRICRNRGIRGNIEMWLLIYFWPHFCAVVVGSVITSRQERCPRCRRGIQE